MTRRIPGPAGMLPKIPFEERKKLLESVGIIIHDDSSFDNYSQYVVPTDPDFETKAWYNMTRDYDIDMFGIKAIFNSPCYESHPMIVTCIESIDRSHYYDASAVFKDPTGKISGTVHEDIISSEWSEWFKPGTVVEFGDISIFKPRKKSRYLTIVPTVVKSAYCGNKKYVMQD